MKSLVHDAIQTGACAFKLEKPKVPVFARNVRDYEIFRSKFKHAIEAKYTKRDAITLLRTYLRDKPLELIKVWEAITMLHGSIWTPHMGTRDSYQTLGNKILCNLKHYRMEKTHTFATSYISTLKEVGLPSDMDNSHMQSIIEQNMCENDRKVWARDLEREKRSLLPCRR